MVLALLIGCQWCLVWVVVLVGVPMWGLMGVRVGMWVPMWGLIGTRGQWGTGTGRVVEVGTDAEIEGVWVT